MQYDAAKYAVRHWHYSRSLPCSKTARFGVWEDDKFIGAVVFAWGANRRLAGEYNLKMTQCARALPNRSGEAFNAGQPHTFYRHQDAEA